MTADDFNRAGVGTLPGYLGVHVLSVNGRELRAELAVRPELMAPNGFLHAGSVVTLADTCCGYGCRANLPEGANGFTTIELKSNHPAQQRQALVATQAAAPSTLRNSSSERIGM